MERSISVNVMSLSQAESWGFRHVIVMSQIRKRKMKRVRIGTCGGEKPRGEVTAHDRKGVRTTKEASPFARKGRGRKWGARQVGGRKGGGYTSGAGGGLHKGGVSKWGGRRNGGGWLTLLHSLSARKGWGGTDRRARKWRAGTRGAVNGAATRGKQRGQREGSGRRYL